MRKSRFSETQIVKMLKEAEASRPVSDICRENGISATTFYKWKTKYGGMEASDVRRLKDLEAEHSRLKQMFAELSLENQALKDVIAKKFRRRRLCRLALRPGRRHQGNRTAPGTGQMGLQQGWHDLTLRWSRKIGQPAKL